MLICRNLLVARDSLIQRRVHVNVVTRKIDGDQELEDECILWVGCREETEETTSRATIRHHIEYSAEFCGLVVFAGSCSIESIEQTRNAVKNRAYFGVPWHVVKRDES